jgi:hypothetical protein
MKKKLKWQFLLLREALEAISYLNQFYEARSENMKIISEIGKIEGNLDQQYWAKCVQYVYPSVSVIVINLIFKIYACIFKVIIFVLTLRFSLHLNWILVLYKMILYISSWNLI